MGIQVEFPSLNIMHIKPEFTEMFVHSFVLEHVIHLVRNTLVIALIMLDEASQDFILLILNK